MPADPPRDLTKTRPMAVFLALPDSVGSPLLDPLNADLWRWADDRDKRRYPPLPQRSFLPDTLQPTANGYEVVTSVRGEGVELRSYLSVTRDGVIEMGIGEPTWFAHRDAFGFRLLPIVGDLWRFLGFVADLYASFKQERPFTLGFGLRGTQGALLGGLAQGWAEPQSGMYAPICREPGIWYQLDGLPPTLGPDEIGQVVRRVATVVDNAWGHRTSRCYVEARVDPAQPFDVQRYHSLVS